MKLGAPVRFKDGSPGLFLQKYGYKKRLCTVLNEKNLIVQTSLSEITQVEDKYEAQSIVEKITNTQGAARKRMRRAMAETHQVDLFQ